MGVAVVVGGLCLVVVLGLVIWFLVEAHDSPEDKTSSELFEAKSAEERERQKAMSVPDLLVSLDGFTSGQCEAMAIKFRSRCMRSETAKSRTDVQGAGFLRWQVTDHYIRTTELTESFVQSRDAALAQLPDGYEPTDEMVRVLKDLTAKVKADDKFSEDPAIAAYAAEMAILAVATKQPGQFPDHTLMQPYASVQSMRLQLEARREAAAKHAK